MKTYLIYETDENYDYVLITDVLAISLLSAVNEFKKTVYYLGLGVKAEDEVPAYIEDNKAYLVWGNESEFYYTIEEKNK